MVMSTNATTNPQTHEAESSGGAHPGGEPVESGSTQNARRPAPDLFAAPTVPELTAGNAAAAAELPAGAPAATVAAAPASGEPTPPTPEGQPAPSPQMTQGGSALRRGLSYVKRHPLGSIAALTAAGALIEVEMAIVLGAAASAAFLFVNPSGAERRRDLERQLARLGKGAVTAIREALDTTSGARPPKP